MCTDWQLGEGRVAVNCSVLHCVVVCYSELQGLAVWCSVVQGVAVCCSVLQECETRVAERDVQMASWWGACCSVLQCVAACCSVLQRVAACCSVLQCGAACCSVSQECETRVAERDVQSFNLVRHVLQGRVLRGVVGRGGVLQYVAVCCSVL